MTPTCYPPVLLFPDRSADAPRVLAAIERLRPQYVVVVGSPFASCLAGLQPYALNSSENEQLARAAQLAVWATDHSRRKLHDREAEKLRDIASGRLPRLIICESDPALRVAWEAARSTRGEELSHEVVEALCLWRDRFCRYNDNAAQAFGELCSLEDEWTDEYAWWALAAAAGCRDGRWARDASGRLASPYHASGDPGEVERRLFPAPPRAERPGDYLRALSVVLAEREAKSASPWQQAELEAHAAVQRKVLDGTLMWRSRAEAAQAFAQAHVESIYATVAEAWDHAGRVRGVLALLDGVTDADLIEDVQDSVRLGLAHVVAWASDETIDLWAPISNGTEIVAEGDDRWSRVDDSPELSGAILIIPRENSRLGGIARPDAKMPRRAHGITWTRQDDNSWIGSNTEGF